jgi:UDP-glucose 4-epimerase
MNVLVTGGAGYIGSHAVKCLAEKGHRVVALDNLFRGHRQAVPANIPFEQADLRQTDALGEILTRHRIDCVMHFAALAYVGESVTEPLRYYDNNTAGTVSLLRAMNGAGVNRLVFSSTCATYGEPERMPITEDMAQRPINPYGWSKLFVERVLLDYGHANKGFAFAAPRYFNVAGCARDGSLGEDHEPETHLIPVLLNAALGKAQRRAGQGPQGHRLRRGLPDARRHVHPRLHPRRRPRRGARRVDGGAAAGRQAVLQPRHRPGLHGHAGDRGREARDRHRLQGGGRPAPPR